MILSYLKYPVYLITLFSFILPSHAQEIDLRHTEPVHWWAGMKDPRLQIMLHGEGIGNCTASLGGAPLGIKLRNAHTSNNPNYLFLDFEIQPQAKAGTFPILLKQGKKSRTLLYRLKARSEIPPGAKGYGPEDVLYLIMPDRFANGDTTNDSPEEAREKLSRTEPYGRHGGDLAGIEKNLQYLKDLGITTLWLNPVLENNQPHQSYHGYAFTNFYKIDPRFGSLDDYKRLIRKCHENGLKMVQDMVANHIGSKHWWMDDRPDSTWIHPEGDPFNRSNFRIETIPDPNGDKSDQDKMLKGWFDIHMPDLNQRNPRLARYLIQNSIWWIAETGIDGIRMDTYPYNYKEFMTSWCESILKEFPSFSLVGEVWVEPPGLASYFVKGAKNQDGYKAGLPTLTDFPLYFALNKSLTEKGTWDNGLQRVYNVLAQDFLYADASKHLIFLDNHDLTRVLTYHKGNLSRLRQALTLLLTLRGVPQLYYGTEILMTGDGASHAAVRKDFPGGWAKDSLDLFQEKNRTGKVDSAFRQLQTLLRWRKTSEAVTKGSFTHFLPENNVYCYFRTYKDKKVMVVVNGNEKEETISLRRFSTLQKSPVRILKDVVSGVSVDLSGSSVKVPALAAWIFEIP